jgi:ClpP class serine protease
MIRYPHIAACIFNTPLLIHPGKLDAIIAGLAPRFGADGVLDPQAYTSLQGEKKAPGYRVVAGVGVLDVFGVLVHRSRLEADSTFLLGYQEVAKRFEAALADPAVESVLLNLDSPGGEVARVFDLVEQVKAARG